VTGSTRSSVKVMLDASAILAWVFEEKGFSAIEQVLDAAAITSANMVEVLYVAMSRGYPGDVEVLHEDLLDTGLLEVAVTEADSVRAAELISLSRDQRQHPNDPALSLGDGLCIAVAERMGLPIAGGDEHWDDLTLRTPYHLFR